MQWYLEQTPDFLPTIDMTDNFDRVSAIATIRGTMPGYIISILYSNVKVTIKCTGYL